MGVMPSIYGRWKWHLHSELFESLDFSKIALVWETSLSDNYRENSLA